MTEEEITCTFCKQPIIGRYFSDGTFGGVRHERCNAGNAQAQLDEND